MQDSRTPANPQSDRYAHLDPNNEHWESYANNLNVIVALGSKDGYLLTKDVRSLRDKLEQAWASSGNSGVRKALYWGFIDHVVSRRQGRDIAGFDEFRDLRYPTEWFSWARQLQREIHLHVGPTNSGKTYNALKRLEAAGKGFYAGPLRLLAHEVYSRFRAKGLPCDLITGDDIRIDGGERSPIVSATVEMTELTTNVEVGVIDEIQMIADPDRGWAWTRALLGANAKELHLCGETRVVPLVKELAASMGDTLHIHRYERLNALKVMKTPLGDFKNLRKGDCIVAFSIIVLHSLKKQIELDTGRRVAIVYGGLPPEIRAKQAELFNDSNNDYDFLVASDAIGMGLNLTIKRIIFHSTWKRLGSARVRVSIPQIKQIAGRAGRYRTAREGAIREDSTLKSLGQPDSTKAAPISASNNVGLVTCLDEDDLPYIDGALCTEPEPIKQAALLPPDAFIEEISSRLPKGIPFEYILHKMSTDSILHPRYNICNVEDQSGIARTIEDIQSLTATQRYTICASPADTKSLAMQTVLKAYAKCIAENKMVTVADIDELPLEILDKPLSDSRDYMSLVETLHKSLILFLWLSYRFVNVFKDRNMANYAKSLVEDKINRALVEFSANPKFRKKALTRVRGSEADVHAGTKSIEDGVDSVAGELTEMRKSTEKTRDIPVELSDRSALPIKWDCTAIQEGGIKMHETEEGNQISAHG